jgi:hypothetical protein
MTVIGWCSAIGWSHPGIESTGTYALDTNVSGNTSSDSVWDLLAARRARALSIGLLSGGYGTDELERAGAFRVYEDPGDLLRHLDEVGIRELE